MPPNIDLKPLSGKRDNAIYALNELFVEFKTLYSVKPELNLLAAVFNEIESKNRAVKKQIEIIAEEGEKRNHHRSFHNEKKVYPSKSNLDPNAPSLPLTAREVQIRPSLKTRVSREETTRALTMSRTYLEFVQFRKSEAEVAKETSKP